MSAIEQTNVYKECMEQMKKGGCFLVTGHEKPNVMTIGWGTTGILWSRPVFMVAVRLSRYSHTKLDALDEFTVCVPSASHSFQKELAFCGVESGREVDKAAALGLKFIPSEKISVPGIKGCSAIYECKTIYRTEMHEAFLESRLVQHYYAAGDYHTLYFGEILACHQA